MGQWGQTKAAAGGGTSPETIQQIFGAEWWNSDRSPIIKGGEVSGRSNLRYGYAAGVGLVKTAFGAVKVSWGSGQTAPVAQPSVAREDEIYASADGLIRVATKGSRPADTCRLDTMRLPAGATATSSAVRSAERDYALHYGSQVGWFGAWAHIPSGAGPHPVSKTNVVVTSIPFWVPTDRWVDIPVQQSIYGGVDYGLPDSDARKMAFGAMEWNIFLDNVHQKKFELPFSRILSSAQQVLWRVPISFGQHTLRVERKHVWGADPFFFGGNSDTRDPSFVGIDDHGVRI